MRQQDPDAEQDKHHPPAISIAFPNFFPSRLPIRNPSQDINTVTTPMTMAGYQIVTPINPKLKPTARASMLTAMESSTIVQPREGSVFCCSVSRSKPARIIRPPTNTSRPKATQ